MSANAVIPLVAAFLALSGCAGQVIHEGKYPQEEGWYKGEVVQIGPVATINKLRVLHDCRVEEIPGASDTPFVSIAYRQNGHPYSRVVRLPADGQLNVGDKVYVNIKNCDAPIPKRQ